MIQRLALLLGGVGAAGVLAVALGVGGFFAPPGTAIADQPISDTTPLGGSSEVAAADVAAGGGLPDAPVTAPSTTQAQPPVVVRTVKDTIYIAPTPKPRVVHVPAPNRPTANSARPPRSTNRVNTDRTTRTQPAANSTRDDGRGADDRDDGYEDEHESADEHESDEEDHASEDQHDQHEDGDHEDDGEHEGEH